MSSLKTMKRTKHTPQTILADEIFSNLDGWDLDDGGMGAASSLIERLRLHGYFINRGPLGRPLQEFCKNGHLLAETRHPEKGCLICRRARHRGYRRKEREKARAKMDSERNEPSSSLMQTAEGHESAPGQPKGPPGARPGAER